MGELGHILNLRTDFRTLFFNDESPCSRGMGGDRTRIGVRVAHLGLKDLLLGAKWRKRIGIPSFGRQATLLCNLAAKTADPVLLQRAFLCI